MSHTVNQKKEGGGERERKKEIFSVEFFANPNCPITSEIEERRVNGEKSQKGSSCICSSGLRGLVCQNQ